MPSKIYSFNKMYRNIHEEFLDIFERVGQRNPDNHQHLMQHWEPLLKLCRNVRDRGWT